MNLKPYPKYKDSGIEWLGKVPEGWEVIPLRRIGEIVNGSTPESSNEDYWDGDIAWLTPDDLGKHHNKYITDSKRKITYKGYINCGTTIVPKDSLILSTRAPIGHLALSSLEVCFNQGCRGIIFPNNYSPSFYYYYFSTLKEVLNSYGQGTTFFELGANKLASINVVIPSLQEQTAIATFLDQKTTKIDELIKKNERLIELLREKRQAIISHAVTKGLDPNAKMKDSGIGWIGEIPEGWEVKRLKFMSIARPSNVDKKNEVGETEVRLCNYTDVYNNESIDDSIDFMVASATSDEIKKFRILRGDVLITKDSEEWNDIAVPSFVNGTLNTVLCGYHLALVRPEAGMIEGKYLFWSFQSYNINTQFRVSANGITRYGLSKNSISSAFFLVPPLPEQTAIANYLDQKTARIDGTIQKIQSQIAILKEYRQALISNVVTGKLRVN